MLDGPKPDDNSINWSDIVFTNPCFTMVITILFLPLSSTTTPLFSLLWYFSAELMSVLSGNCGHRYFWITKQKLKRCFPFVKIMNQPSPVKVIYWRFQSGLSWGCFLKAPPRIIINPHSTGSSYHLAHFSAKRPLIHSELIHFHTVWMITEIDCFAGYTNIYIGTHFYNK